MFFIRKKVFILFFVIFLIYVMVLIFSLLWGSQFLNIYELFSRQEDTLMLVKFRFMRIATAFLVGGSLSLAGCVYQAVLRNPLAEPYILGVSSGASLGVALSFITGMAALSVYTVPGFAVAGAVLILAMVLLYGSAGKGTESLLLAGVIAGTIASGLLVTILSFADSSEISSVFWFLLGDLSSADPALFRLFAILVPVISILLCLLSPKSNILALGNEYAWSMGLDPLKMTLIFVGLASLLAAMSAALAGIIGFAGLIIPHIIRKCSFYDNRVLFPASFFSGGVFLTLCDLVSRTLISQREIPVGVITALLGGPLFLWILHHKKSSSAGSMQ